MGARVLYRDSQGRDDQVQLTSAQPCFVGRSLECAIRTDDAMVSRKHSRIWMENGRFFVEDLDSSNGTHVNNERVVGRRMLQHNDVVRCGSLWLRYVEDGPLGSPQPPQGGGAAPAKKNKPGTMRLDRKEVHQQSGSQPQQPQQPQQPLRQPPQQPQGYQQPQRPGGYGQPQAAHQQSASQPVRQPPQPPQPQRPPQPPQPPQQPQQPQQPQGPAAGAYGGPPPMPGGGAAGAQPGAPAMPAESSIVVDMGADPGEVAKYKKKISDLQERFDKLQANHDREVADGKRMRAESSTLKERIDELRGTIKDRDEQVQAHSRVGEELRDELAQTKEELRGARDELGGMGEEIQARERKLARSEEDIGKLKEELDDRNRKLGEISKTKDEGWKKLNEQLAEIDHLREVINEQERMLEERRVGLVSQEQVIKELRANKEEMIKEVAQVKASRDQLITNDSRRNAQILAIDEENKRISRMLAEAQANAMGESGGASATEHTMKINAELKDLRVEFKKLESDAERTKEQLDRADLEVETQKHRVAQLEVELREAQDARTTAESGKNLAEEARTKAEVARHKAAEEALEAAKARDTAMTSADDSRREADRLKKKVEQLEATGNTVTDEPDPELVAEVESTKRKLKLALDKAAELERSMKTLEAELVAAKSDAKQVVDFDDAEDTDPGGSVPGGGDAIRDLASEVYEGINDVLSEIRSNLMLVQGEFSALAKDQQGDSVSIISDTLDALIANAEDAKGTVRRLRELVEFGG